jgi:hypothetical protein
MKALGTYFIFLHRGDDFELVCLGGGVDGGKARGKIPLDALAKLKNLRGNAEGGVLFLCVVHVFPLL